ncbi:uridine kinase [Haliangium ochraceum]|uniref:Uridine kinase n=1 Tax=Haliangium ochraceum (strain DSM 14365 / JCM 11303 / SMP-2) TaxID=502025 RepID=D0LYS6_HALO1|nr:uridine kinase [Haliangium ochraceum DSM 14365]
MWYTPRIVTAQGSFTPLIIGIAGGTGSGKTTVARKLAAHIPEGRCALIEHDSYYRDLGHLTIEERDRVNVDHPDALDSDLLVEHLTQLRAGHTAEVPVYDFVTHTRRHEVQRVEPSPVIIVEGILVFVEERLRSLFDIKIFVDTDADIRLIRRIRRDIEQRGRSFSSVRDKYYRTVRPMHMAYVEPSKRWADLILPEGGDNRVALDVLLGKLARAAFDLP